MTVFRGYLLIIKRNWGFIFIYTALFLFTMLIIQGETQKKEEKEFQRSRLKIAVVDEDGGMLAEGLTNYLATLHEITEIGNAEGTLLEAIYYGEISSVIRIPRGVGEKWEVQLTKIPGYAESDYLKQQINLFLNQVQFCTENGYSMQEAFELVNQQLEEKSVRLLNLNGNQGKLGILLLYFSFPSIPFHCSIVSDLKYSDECIPEERNQDSGCNVLQFLCVARRWKQCLHF
mgnify:CR=1 FL=1